MQLRILWLSLGLSSLAVSCASPPTATAPVGPPPASWGHLQPVTQTGELQVFTETDEYEFDHDVPYFPHRDYQIYSENGQRLRRVWNSRDHEDETPAVVDLPAGRYLVKADAAFYGRVSVPVLIKANQLTKVILQPGWNPGNTVASSDLVRMPNGYFIGWAADIPAEKSR